MSVAGGAAVIATFTPGSHWAGKTISYKTGQLALEGEGELSDEEVLDHDRQGLLGWVSAVAKESV